MTYYYQLKGKEFGPVEADQVLELDGKGKLTDGTLLRRADESDWTTLEALRDDLKSGYQQNVVGKLRGKNLPTDEESVVKHLSDEALRVLAYGLGMGLIMGAIAGFNFITKNGISGQTAWLMMILNMGIFSIIGCYGAYVGAFGSWIADVQNGGYSSALRNQSSQYAVIGAGVASQALWIFFPKFGGPWLAAALIIIGACVGLGLTFASLEDKIKEASVPAIDENLAKRVTQRLYGKIMAPLPWIYLSVALFNVWFTGAFGTVVESLSSESSFNETIDEGSYWAQSIEPTTHVSISITGQCTGPRIDAFIFDAENYDKYTSGKDWKYYPSMSNVNTASIAIDGVLSAGKYFVVIDNTSAMTSPPWNWWNNDKVTVTGKIVTSVR